MVGVVLLVEDGRLAGPDVDDRLKLPDQLLLIHGGAYDAHHLDDAPGGVPQLRHRGNRLALLLQV